MLDHANKQVSKLEIDAIKSAHRLKVVAAYSKDRSSNGFWTNDKLERQVKRSLFRNAADKLHIHVHEKIRSCAQTKRGGTHRHTHDVMYARISIGLAGHKNIRLYQPN